MNTELLNSTINPSTYRDPPPYQGDENIYENIGNDINIDPYDIYIKKNRPPTNIIKLNIRKQENVNKTSDDATRLRISYTI